MVAPPGEPFPWQCPYCEHFTTVGPHDTSYTFLDITRGTELPSSRFIFRAILCSNPECGRVELNASHHIRIIDLGGTPRAGEEVQKWRLIPPRAGRVFPNFIPAPIRQDYSEAFLVLEASPKAAATLARRCLQGMIRDFWKVRAKTLAKEIDKLRGKVEEATWKAIHAVRKVGNIGAHMEKDINLVVEVEPDEAEMLIGLVERLLQDWYVARYERDEHTREVLELAARKDAERQAAKGGATP